MTRRFRYSTNRKQLALMLLSLITSCFSFAQQTIFQPTDVPATLLIDDGPAIEVGLKFRATVNGTITGVRFYKGAGNTGTHIGHLWTTANTTTPLATVTFTGETASGWQQMLFTTPVAITTGQTYVISYYSSDGFYSETAQYFLNAPVVNGSLRALQNGEDGPNGIYKLNATASPPTYPNATYVADNYFVDVVFVATDVVPPTVTTVSPLSGASGVNINSAVTAVFSEPLDAATVSTSTFELRNVSNTIIPATVTYTSGTNTATLTPSSPLSASSSYTVTLKGGATGSRIKDVVGNALAADYTWSFTTTFAAPLAPENGPGGPILVISSLSNLFSRFPVEILRAEGLNEFAAMDIGNVTAGILDSYDVVVLGEMEVTGAQATMLTNWVTAGGTLIAFRPTSNLNSLMGISSVNGTLDDKYLLVNTAPGPGLGIVNQTIQYHGTADLYTLTGGATSLATLYSNATTATTNPAITTRTVGSGKAIAFSYDLAGSIVFTRQGNPAAAGTETDGQAPIRSDDLFFPNYVDMDKVAIPQADEQQRLLANIIIQSNLAKKPLPRFWYLPGGNKAAIVYTVDDHSTASGTKDIFNKLKANSPVGGTVANWTAYRATSWFYVGIPLTDSLAGAYNSQGFEMGAHVTNNCNNFTSFADLDSSYRPQLQAFKLNYPSLPAQTTHRFHCIIWSDWLTQAKVELSRGIRYSMDYYYWPPSWINNRPGLFTGSGMPMRFADSDGSLVDIYQGVSNLVNENGVDYNLGVNTLLDNAIGSKGYYGLFGTHDDYRDTTFSTAVINSAKARGVPIISARQALNWIDGRNNSSFGSITWSSNQLSFSVTAYTGADNLKAMLPLYSSNGQLSSITKNGSAITFTTQTIKGMQYAFFDAPIGVNNFVATYAVDATAPVISNIVATPNANGTSATITWTTNEGSDSKVDYGTVSSNLNLNSSDNSPVTSHSVVLTGLTAGTTYFFRVTSKDVVNNSITEPATNNTPLSFVMPLTCASDLTNVDFNGGTTGANTVVVLEGNGGVILKPALIQEFVGPGVPSGWTSAVFNAGGGTTVANSVTVSGTHVYSNSTVAAGTSIEFAATFRLGVFQNVGFTSDQAFNNAPWVTIGQAGGMDGNLYARASDGTMVNIGSNLLGSQHTYRINWNATSFTFYIDGNTTPAATINLTVSSNMFLQISDVQPGDGTLTVNWIRTSTYVASGTYTSRVFSAGSPKAWGAVVWNSDVPVNTSLAIAVRTGNTLTPDGTWSGYNTISASGNVVGATSQYIQYTATFATTDTKYTSQLKDISISCAAPVSAPAVTTQPATQTICAGSNVTFTSAASGTPAPIVQWQVSTNGGTTWTNINGAVSSSYTFATTIGDNSKKYRAVWTNSVGSVNSNAATLTVNTVPTAPTVSVANNCGNSVLTASNFTGTLLWSNSATTTAITVTNAATYTVTQTVNGCTSATGSGTSAPIAVPSAPTVNVVNNCGNSVLTAGNFTGTLLWSNSATTTAITVTNAATYTVTQTVNGCASANGIGTSAPVAIPSAPTVSVADNCGNSVLTAGNFTGTLLWSNSATTPSITVTNAATYTVTQTVSGCTSLSGSGTSAPVAVPSAPTVTVVDSCGKSTLTAGNFTGTLLWSNSATTTSITVTNAATYTVNQTVSGCSSLSGSGTSAPVSTPSAPTVTVVDSCGKSVLTAGNFTGTLLWSNGATPTSITVTNAATYTVTQTVNGCTSANGSGTSAPITAPSAPTVSVVNNCGNSVLTAGNFTGSLLWSNGATTSSITVNDAAAYTVTQTVNGCASASGSGSSAPKAIPSAPTVNVVDNCGNSVLTASGITGTLLWSNNATTSAITVTNAATYTVAQTLNGCASANGSGTSAPKEVPAAPTVTVVNNCGNSVLTATNYSGTLLWSEEGQSTQSITVTASGTYNVIQTVGGCTSAAAQAVAAPKTIPSAPTVTVVNNCGNSILTASNVTGSLLWNNSLTTPSITVHDTATYTVTQTINGCASSLASGNSEPKVIPGAPTVAVINNCGNSLLTATNYSGTLLWSEEGQSTPSISVTESGTYQVIQIVGGCTSVAAQAEAAPKLIPSAPTVTVVNNCGSSVLTASDFSESLLWSNGETTPSITVTNAANYTITQTAVNGCVSATANGTSAPKAIPSTPTITVVNNCGNSVLTAGDFTGALLWSNGATTPSITVTNEATYTLTQTGANGCVSTFAFDNSSPKPIPSAPVVTVVNNCGNSTLTASDYTGTLLWSNGAATPSVNVTNAATYTITQTGVNGCTSAAGSGVSAPKTIPSAPSVTVANNCGTSVLTAGSYAGSLLWSNGASVSSISVNDAATYTVTQTMPNGCTSSNGSGATAPKPIPSAPTVTVTNNCASSVLTAGNFTGSLLWNNGSTSSSITVTNAATYSVSQNVNGCVSTTGSAVSAPKPIPSAPVVTVTNNCGNSILTAGNYTGSLLWSNAATTPSITVTNNAIYTVTQTINGCTSPNTGGAGSGTSVPKAIPRPPVVSIKGSTTFCQGGSVTLMSDLKARNTWSNGATTQSIIVSTSGTYTVTYTSEDGCISVASIPVVVTVKPIPAAPTAFAINNCGNTLLTAANYTGTLLWNTGATTSTITVTAPATYNIRQIINGCTSAAGSVEASPKTVPASPTVTVTNNCGYSLLTVTNITGTLLWDNGASTPSIMVGNAATYSVIQTGANGCVSVPGSGVSAPKTIPSAPVITAGGPTVFCQGGSVVLTSSAASGNLWNNGAFTQSITVNTPGSYTVSAIAANGCISPSSAPTTVTVKTPSSSTTNVTICSSQLPYNWNDHNYTIAGAYTIHLTNAAGCDSAATLNLAVKQVTTSDTTAVACNSYGWHGTTYFASGNYTYTTINAAGCDSVRTLHLTINTSTTSDTTAVACNSYGWHGTTYFASGNYTYTTINAAGCDSVRTLHLTINTSTTSDTTAVACNSYGWHGTTYFASGNYTYTTINAAGCDSVRTLHLTINVSTTSDTTAVACNSYGWHGTTYFASGNYTYTTINAAGCDSVRTLHLTIKLSTTSDTTAVACNSYGWHGSTYFASGNYTYTTINAAGCDSVRTLHLTINTSSTSDTTAVACNSYGWHGTTYFASGNYTYTTINAAGCDSVRTLHLTINTSSTSDTTAVACNSYGWHGTTYFATGNYTYTTINAAGCDSVRTLHLTINTSTTSDTTAVACNSYGWHGTTYFASGNYTYTTINAAGCDSVRTLHLTINVSTTSDTTAVACNSYGWHGTTYFASGNYTYTTINSAGCDSVRTLHLTINTSSTSDTTAVACNSYGWHGTTYFASGNYTYTTINAAGCDSVRTLHLTINTGSTSDTTAVACNSYGWHGTTYFASGNYTYTTVNAAGCDSVRTLHLTINVSTTSDTTVTACGSYVWNSINHTTSGVYIFNTTNAAGCDSTATLHLTINAVPDAPTITTSEGVTTFCAGGSVILASDSTTGNKWYRNGVLLNGQTDDTYTATISGTYTVTYTSGNGCESAPSNTIVVTVNPLPTLTSSLTATVTSNTLFSYTPTSATAGTTFNWTRAAVTGVSNTAGSGTDDIGTISETLVDTAGTSVNVTYVYTLVAPTGCSNTQNLVVTVNPSGSRIITVVTVPKPSTQPIAEIKLDVAAIPNPTTNWFNLVIKSNNDKVARVRVINLTGRIVEDHQKVTTGTVLKLGESWTGGTYFIEVIQGEQRKVIKLIKTN